MAVKVEKYPGASVKNGKLYFGGADVTKLAKEYGTPLYVIDEQVLRGKCREYRKEFESRYPGVKVLLASKALMSVAVSKIVTDEGFGLDVASVGEMYGGMKAGVSPSEMVFHGNYKKEEDLLQAVKKGIGRIVLDSALEAKTLDAVAKKLKTKQKVLLRITPGVEAHTHELIQTGKLDTKFGVPIEGGAAMELIGIILKMKNLEFMGVHYHIGSQIFDVGAFKLSAQKATTFLKALKEKHGVEIKELDVGGGYPVRYTSDQPLPTPGKFAATICGSIKAEMKAAGLSLPFLYLEPGRSVVGPSGITLYTVGPVKEIKGVRIYCAVDGGISDNPRPSLYDAEYEAVIANRADAKKGLKKYRVCGRHCETDNLIKEIELADPKPGDVMAVFSTGAYCYTMSMNYNKYPRPEMVLVNKGKSEVIIKRETIESLFRNDVIPDRLK